MANQKTPHLYEQPDSWQPNKNLIYVKHQFIGQPNKPVNKPQVYYIKNKPITFYIFGSTKNISPIHLANKLLTYVFPINYSPMYFQ